jgi:NADP-dependent 3-hydroxy acid dehydrogenase YdfG
LSSERADATLRGDLLGADIRVTVLLPGRVQTRLYDGIFGGNADRQ